MGTKEGMAIRASMSVDASVQVRRKRLKRSDNAAKGGGSINYGYRKGSKEGKVGSGKGEDAFVLKKGFGLHGVTEQWHG